jgi:hypothetical protein
MERVQFLNKSIIGLGSVGAWTGDYYGEQADKAIIKLIFIIWNYL